MAVTEITAIRPHGFRQRLGSFLSAVGVVLNAYGERRGRFEQITRLNAMSDAELAKLGISRDRIPHYVFRDLMHV